MPKRRKRKCTEPRCCWHQGWKGRTSEGLGGWGRLPVPSNKRCLEDAVPGVSRKNWLPSRDRGSPLPGADGFLRPAQTYAPTTERSKNNAPPCRTTGHSPKKYVRGLLKRLTRPMPAVCSWAAALLPQHRNPPRGTPADSKR